MRDRDYPALIAEARLKRRRYRRFSAGWRRWTRVIKMYEDGARVQKDLAQRLYNTVQV